MSRYTAATKAKRGRIVELMAIIDGGLGGILYTVCTHHMSQVRKHVREDLKEDGVDGLDRWLVFRVPATQAECSVCVQLYQGREPTPIGRVPFQSWGP